MYRVATPPAPPEGDSRARAEIAPSLEPGETLLWAGQPKQGLRFTLTDLFLIPFSFAWASFTLFWESVVLYGAITQGGAAVFGAAFGLPFVAVGLYMLVGRFLYDRAKRARTFYGLTDRRALIVEAGRKKRNETSIDLTSQTIITLSEAGAGRGTLHFGPAEAETPSGLAARSPATPVFYRIERAREVHERIREAARVRRLVLEDKKVRVAKDEEVAADVDASRAEGQLRP